MGSEWYIHSPISHIASFRDKILTSTYMCDIFQATITYRLINFHTEVSKVGPTFNLSNNSHHCTLLGQNMGQSSFVMHNRQNTNIMSVNPFLDSLIGNKFDHHFL